ncbi:hypothetical protein Nepgr_028437 [Nepenthes gracilis]|uniref:C2 NT-type domain-containing protein n=1 Tax=Nepenthes gracilis TaxID=150966 RepID=A0AAD3Y445_NEPGR|nr:hypothetical protein Nepgr_028437 [Nepenthes gracilis]
MFKSVRWRSEKNTITAVFKLRFHATQVSQLGENALVLSVVPADNGKPTAKLEKYTIRDGCLLWENPVYETVKFVQDPKAGKFHERIYNFIITTEPPKSSLVGEASVNVAEYAEETKAASVSFPFKYSNSEGVLHVSIQRINENANQGDLEENGVANIKSGNRNLKRYFSNGDAKEGTKANFTKDEPLRKSMSHMAALNGDCRTSSGSDITFSSSDSSSGLDTPRKFGAKNNGIHPELNAVDYEDQHRAQWERSLIPAHDAFPNGRSQLALDDTVESLKSDLVALARKTEMTELELQTLRKQIVKESKRGQDLMREVAGLKEERDALKEECKQLKASQKWGDELKFRSKVKFEGDPWALLENISQELNYEKDLNSNLRVQLQKTQESNSELILAVRDLEQMLEQNNRGVSDLSIETASANRTKEHEENFPRSESDDDEIKELEEIVKQHTDAREAHLLEQQIIDLCSDIEVYRREKDELEMQLEQLALDYEILKQENHEKSYKLEQSQLQEQLKFQYECSSSYATVQELEMQIEKLEIQLKKQSQELSDFLAAKKELESHILSLEEDREKQEQGFEADLAVVNQARVEQELKIEKLENELKKRSKECCDSEDTVRKLEYHIKTLEEEIEKQAQGFEADLEVVTRAKVEQELKIEKLEDELQIRSIDLSDSLATMKELEAQMENLEEELQKRTQDFEADLEALTFAKVEQEQRAIRAEETLRLTRWKNVNTAERLQEEFKRLSMQIQSIFEANEKLATKAFAEASELRLQNSHLEEMLQKATYELQSAKDDYEANLQELYDQLNMKSNQIKQLLAENEEESKQLEHQKKHEDEVSLRFSEELSMLRDEVERLKVDNHLLYEQAGQTGKLKAELEQMEAKIKEKGLLVESMKIERKNLEGRISLVKEDESEKEKLREQVFQLKADLKKKEDALTSAERKLKDNNGRATVIDKTKATSKSSKPESVSRGAKEVTTLKEKIKLLEGQMKLKETALETSANAFLEKEKGLHNKIEELERRVEELNQNSTTLCDDKLKKGDNDVKDSAFLNCTANEEGSALSLIKSNGEISPDTQLNFYINKARDQNIVDLLKEIVILKESNSSMDIELKDMQERYSELSLKFAEVEGERQQLVMTLRNLKNAAKKS